MISFGGRVADKRRSLKMSQEVLAQEAGISRNYISMIECNKVHNMEVRTLGKLANALGLDVAFLFGRYTEWELESLQEKEKS